MAIVKPHPFIPKGRRIWLCNLCYGPKSIHPRIRPVRKRPENDNTYLSENAPHFNEGW